jgi:hypothetical protein
MVADRETLAREHFFTVKGQLEGIVALRRGGTVEVAEEHMEEQEDGDWRKRISVSQITSTARPHSHESPAVVVVIHQEADAADAVAVLREVADVIEATHRECRTFGERVYVGG